jgi:hypothetical protein
MSAQRQQWPENSLNGSFSSLRCINEFCDRPCAFLAISDQVDDVFRARLDFRCQQSISGGLKSIVSGWTSGNCYGLLLNISSSRV